VHSFNESKFINKSMQSSHLLYIYLQIQKL